MWENIGMLHFRLTIFFSNTFVSIKDLLEDMSKVLFHITTTLTHLFSNLEGLLVVYNL